MPRRTMVAEQASAFIRARTAQGNEPSLSEIAKHCGYSKYYVSRVFKDAMGCTIRQYQEAVKVEHSTAWLLAARSVTHSAVEAGYSSLGSFATTFQRHTGVRPSQYKAQSDQARRVLKEVAKPGQQVYVQRTVAHCSALHNQLDVQVIYPPGYRPHISCVGLFATGVPKGAPAIGAALVRKTRTTFTNIPPGTYYVLACELRFGVSPRTVLRQNYRQKHPRPITFTGHTQVALELRMRLPVASDPPITMNFPVLLMQLMRRK